MTKAFINTKKIPKINYNKWEQTIIAPKLTLRNFSDEMHYYFRIYLQDGKRFPKIILFLFLNVIQRIFYTIGTLIIKLNFVKIDYQNIEDFNG